MTRIIAIDFDGTLFENNWPNIGAPIPEIIEAAKAEKAAGSKLILWTNRAGAELDAAIQACEAQGLTFDAVNENLPFIVEKFGSDTRKVVASEYWDDKAVPVSMLKLTRAVEKALCTRVPLSRGVSRRMDAPLTGGSPCECLPVRRKDEKA